LKKFSLNNSDHEEVSLFLINLVSIQLPSLKNLGVTNPYGKKHMEIYYLNFKNDLCIDKSCFNTAMLNHHQFISPKTKKDPLRFVLINDA
jgi:hypothetical protein